MAIRFIDDDEETPESQVEIIMDPTLRSSALSGIDLLYTQILSSIKNEKHVVAALGTIIAIGVQSYYDLRALFIKNPCTRGLVEDLAGRNPATTRLVLGRLHSLLSGLDDDIGAASLVGFFHTSFRDYLLDQHRSGRYFVSIPDANAQIANLAISRISHHLLALLDKVPSAALTRPGCPTRYGFNYEQTVDYLAGNFFIQCDRRDTTAITR